MVFVNRGSQEPVRVLVIEDDPAVRRLTAAALTAQHNPPMRLREAANLAEGTALLRDENFSAAVLSLDGGSAAELVPALRQAGLLGPIVATSRKGSVSVAVEAMRHGADDFMVKPYQAADLARRLANLIQMEATRELPVQPDVAAPGFEGFEGFIGGSEAMRSLYDQIIRIAPSKAPVFITGESGTGKEVSAEAIHARSERSSGPFIALNCSAIPKELMESEIFGHMKGAFTGAHEDRAGAAELAHGGTLFLDEICEMDLGLQAKLLRFVQIGSIRRVGDIKERAVDVRFICATNRDPASDVATGRFREDLYYRLHVLPLHLPPLRERTGDIVQLARAFLARYAEEEGRAFTGFSPAAEAALEQFGWPGNVRQLQNVIRRVVVLHNGEEVSAEMLPFTADAGAIMAYEAGRDTNLPRTESPTIAPYRTQEQKIIQDALAAFGGNAQKAAAALEIAPSTIYRKLQTWTERRGV
ncbi:MAG TPA: sigma-54 dependent transcriptional regulator [Xanthobacteraceae bacterium]|nr:sigma-54 dependent transcriptional regulator [Xanthobacteraceae bacterium]